MHIQQQERICFEAPLPTDIEQVIEKWKIREAESGDLILNWEFIFPPKILKSSSIKIKEGYIIYNLLL
ncbi:MAG: hypothetical protein IPI78_14980 [Chitinophagaceae bacterium]|nr:hypothetical protein [Chitinophagaceae bacterium]